MVDLEKIIKRLKSFLGVSRDIQLADIFKLSPQDFNKRKKRGTLLPLIIDWAISQTVDMNWLLLGEEGGGDSFINKERSEDPNDQVVELLRKTREVLTSKTQYADSLAANIDSFHRAVELEKTQKEAAVGEGGLGVRVEKLENICGKILEKIENIENPRSQKKEEEVLKESNGM